MRCTNSWRSRSSGGTNTLPTTRLIIYCRAADSDPGIFFFLAKDLDPSSFLWVQIVNFDYLPSKCFFPSKKKLNPHIDAFCPVYEEFSPFPLFPLLVYLLLFPQDHSILHDIYHGSIIFFLPILLFMV